MDAAVVKGGVVDSVVISMCLTRVQVYVCSNDVYNNVSLVMERITTMTASTEDV